MPESRTYQGGCHCGRVRYEVETDLDKMIACNCSICAKHGLWLSFAAMSQFKLLSGSGDLADYRFNTGRINHQFCRNCGTASFARGVGPDGSEMAAINVRCLDGIDVATLRPAPYDGRSK